MNDKAVRLPIHSYEYYLGAAKFLNDSGGAAVRVFEDPLLEGTLRL